MLFDSVLLSELGVKDYDALFAGDIKWDSSEVTDAVKVYLDTMEAGLVAPGGTPRPVIERLHAAFAGAVQSPDVRARLEQANQFPVGNTPGEFATFLRDNATRLSKVVKEANIRAD